MRVLINIESGERIYEDDFDCKRPEGVINALLESKKWIIEGEELIISLAKAPEYLEMKRRELEERERILEEKEATFNRLRTIN